MEIPIALLIGIAVFVLAFYVTIDDRRVIGFCIEGGCVVEERMVGRALWISGSAASIAIGTTIIAMRHRLGRAPRGEAEHGVEDHGHGRVQ